MERKLATIRKISNLTPIEGADKIELAHIDGWKVVVAKDVNHKIGDLVVYCEIDSFLPIEPEFEFLRKSSYKKLVDGTEGFRLKTIRLRGQISQGLIIPLTDANSLYIRKKDPLIDSEEWVEGVDVTEYLGIVKYEPPIPAELAGKVKGLFPSFLQKTDEERVQNLANKYPEWVKSNTTFYATEKLDGSSATFYVRNGEFGVCSRNLELKDSGEFVPGMVTCEDGIERPKQENTFWKVAREMQLKDKLLATNRNICLQGELIGEGIQGNPYKIKGHTVKFYNVFDIDTQKRLSFDDFVTFITSLGLDTVPILTPFIFPNTIEEILKLADGKSFLNPNTDREGLVVRSIDTSISFKAISNIFLSNEK
jgi:RNA ligase (TIGR02306 family)